MVIFIHLLAKCISYLQTEAINYTMLVLDRELSNLSKLKIIPQYFKLLNIADYSNELIQLVSHVMEMLASLQKKSTNLNPCPYPGFLI